MPHPTITPSARGIGRGRLRREDTSTAQRAHSGAARTSCAPIIFIATIGLACLAASAPRADPLAPLEAREIALGGVTGVAYYTIEPEAYRVVATFAGDGDGPRIQVEALLADDSAILVSTSPALGGRGETVSIRRHNGWLTVEPTADPGAGGRLHAALTD
jgi:hypothetical protein